MEGLNFADPQLWIGFLTLTVLEIVLGIDNVVFISILAGKLPENQQEKARKLGLTLALVTRILLLLGISWIVGLTKPLFSILGHSVAGKDLILGIGGLFLIAKATHEIHEKLRVSPASSFKSCCWTSSSRSIPSSPPSAW
jgi:predicted tellurium resistance membrane protein TerC